MANRILIGSHSSFGYGLFVSKDGDDVTNPSKPLIFDSRAGNAWSIKQVVENSIAPNASPIYHTINHGLGYNPLVAMRWSTSITNGKATEVYDPGWGEVFYEDGVQGGGQGDVFSTTWRDGCVWTHHDTNNIRVYNMCNEAYLENDPIEVNDENFLSNSTVYYAMVVFHNADFTGGDGL